ncbi:nectin-1 isoform X1 [Xenopus tropicalis]|uniref:Nectin-1 isoform X1 n=1 Tax=Xenopus tropicalis TaxID=8364 RepID=A0A8J0QSL9_XENTR|nr:nectin-1 isoform X1 [Xenopus tropicalis]|eukprot:XP_002940964.2 PREDICTED: nectin-1-like isoform X1 [Xenopus tropicalis]
MRLRYRSWIVLLLVTLGGNAQVSVIVDREVNAKLGSDTKLYCEVKTPDIISQVTWQRKLSPNNENFMTYSKGEEPMHLTPFGQRVKFLGNGDLGGSILIPNVTLADQGTYLCIFTTFPGGTKEGEIHLSIWVEPSVEVQLNPVLSGPNPDIIAECVAFASKPAANISWDTYGLPHSSTETPVQHSNGTVSVRSQLWMVPSPGLNGHQATCLVSLPEQMYEKLIHMNITNIQYAPQTVHVTVRRVKDDPPYIECWADGNPTVTYAWRRGNRSITDDEAQVTGNTLYFPRGNTDNNGLYVCEATNSIGRNSKSVYLYKYSDATPNCHTGIWITVILLVALVISATGYYYIRKQRNHFCREEDDDEDDGQTGCGLQVLEEERQTGSGTQVLEEEQQTGSGTQVLEEEQQTGSGTQVLEEEQQTGSGTQVLEEEQQTGSGTQVLEEEGQTGSGTQVLEEERQTGSGTQVLEEPEHFADAQSNLVRYG